MPQLGTRKLDDSLFSLELVVDKVYIPHTQCRFPAIAFRLLDYPTIVIKHVEDDLGKAIRSKISFDPDYHLPAQFAELKDRHGNFMVKKGKSCLFRIAVDTLKQHLANTPLYVMIIDLFPEVPKLIGNSSVPLNTLIDSISKDISKLGQTVPSVHGDKGLFKVYNLMGMEIGYFVLGFRLLCLGPSLIPHLPDSILLRQHSEKRGAKEGRSVDEMIQKRENQIEDDTYEPEVQLRSSACMTDPIKHDVLLQTVEMQDQAIHVAVSGAESYPETKAVSEKSSYSTSTQTERRKKIKEAQNVQQKWINLVENQTDDNDEIIINNIICPPPLFYNSNASPSIKIHRQNINQDNDEFLVDDLSDIDSFDGVGLEKAKISRENSQQEFANSNPAVHFKPHREVPSPVVPIPKARVGEIVHGLQVAPNPDTVFPLLTALINELSYIQNPQLLLNVSNRMQAASQKLKKSDQSPVDETKSCQKRDNEKLSPSVVSVVAAALTKKLENSKENKNVVKPEQVQRLRNAHPSGMPENTIQKNQQGQKQSSLHPPKKIKLVYGLTNTQRLRLQKTNPQWLKNVEKEVADMKMKKQPSMKQIDVTDMNAERFADTLTEVRRLAQEELNNTACEDTLLGATKEKSILESTTKQKVTHKKPISNERSVEREERKSKQDDTIERSPNHQLLITTPSPKRRLKPNQSQASQQSEKAAESGEFMRRPVPQVRHLKGFASPPCVDQELSAQNLNDHPSPDLSSKSLSVEVCLPSHDLVNSDDEDDDIPLPDDSLIEKEEPQSINFPKYLSRDISLPESIDGTANTSLNISAALDDNSPLESTRHSKNYTSDKNDSKNLHSTDYDTRQFQSTDEQELQDLVSKEENPSEDDNSGRRSVASIRGSHKFPVINPQLSENSPVPSVRRSTQKLDLTTHNYIPSFSQRFDRSSSSRSATSKSSLSAADLKSQALSPKAGPSQALSPKAGPSQPLSPKGNALSTSKTNILTKLSSSPRRPISQPQRQFQGSVHTDSLSSYMPSDPDNVIISSSISGIYSDDFQLHDIGENEDISVVEKTPKFIPNSKLGYTIN